ncbi:hypothetical protein FGF1_03920 [Flavobacteriaceae bacterium GF1]
MTLDLDQIFNYSGIALGLFLATVYIATHFKKENTMHSVAIFLAGNIIVGGTRLIVLVFYDMPENLKHLAIHIIIGGIISILGSLFGIKDLWTNG